MDLSKARIGKVRTSLMASPGSRHVAGLCHRGQVIDIAIAARTQHDGIRGKGLHFAGNQIACYDSASNAVDDDQIQHFLSREQFDATSVDLSHHRLIGTQQQLLSGLPTAIERSRNLRTTE